MKDAPERLAQFAARCMPAARSEWGAAMVAELREYRGRRDRWEFALGCLRVAAFEAGSGGRMRTMMIAMLTGAALVAPWIYLEVRNGYLNFPYLLFAVLWFVAAAFTLTAAPLVRALRAGESVLARPELFAARVVFLALAGLFWTSVVLDQMPCFLGVPNCD